MADSHNVLDKVIQNLNLVWNRLIEDKKKANGTLVVERDGKIVRFKPQNLPQDILPNRSYSNQHLTAKVEEPDLDEEDAG